ncbi:MAG TPA: hypothetical protein P5107_08065 [Thermotogota bacterium]|nr:hypothetical protein [Thermotogota bacterium]
MKKSLVILGMLIVFAITGVCGLGIINELAGDSRNANTTSLKESVILYEDDPLAELHNLLESDFLNAVSRYTPFLTVLDQTGRILHLNSGTSLDVSAFTDERKASQHRLLLLFTEKEALSRLQGAETLERLYETIKDDRYYMKTTRLYINTYPVTYPVGILHEDLLWDVYVDGISREDASKLALSPGPHEISCPQLVMYNTDPPFKHYSLLVREQEHTQLFYLPEKQTAHFEFHLNKAGDFLEGKTLEIIALRFIPLNQQIIYAQEVLFSSQIKENKAQIQLNQAIQYDNLMSLRTSIPDEDHSNELFRKFYAIPNNRQDVAFSNSFDFLNEKQVYELMIGDDNSVSIMDTEWHTQLVTRAFVETETTRKTGEEIEAQHRKIVITSNQPTTDLYLNDTYVGTAPLTLWLSKTQSYIVKAVYAGDSQTKTINPVVALEEIEFEF